MKIHLFLIAVGLSSCGNSQTESATDSSKVDISPEWSVNGKSSSKEVALGIIEFLRNADTSQYLMLAIPLEGQKLIFERNFDPKTGFKEYHEAQLDTLESKYPSALENFIVRSGYIHKIMIRDKEFHISKASIDTIIVEKLPANMFRGESFPKENWNMVTVVMDYNKEKFYFEIPQIVELEGKWFLYYPEYYLRDQKELDFVNSIRNKKD
jgi:hypothetical protein